MEWVEITAKTVEAAKERALDELGVAADEAEFVIVEEPRRGLFHQVRGTARVRARVSPRTPRAKADRRGRRSRKDDVASNEAGRDRTPAGDDADRPTRESKKPSRAKSGSKSASKSDPKSSERRSPKAPTDQATHRDNPKKTASSAKPTNQEGTTMSMTLDEQINATESFLEGLLEAGGLDGTVSTERTDDANAYVNIVGDNLGLLIGPRGQTMNAIQDLARVVLQKQAAGSWEGHVHVDVNSYRAKRRAALVAFVEKVATDVIETGKAKALEPMSASDRKIVHDTVNGLDGVRTTSEGHEPRRWVKIVPDEG